MKKSVCYQVLIASNGHRYYRDDDLRRLILIRRCRDLLPIDEVRELVDLFEDGDRSARGARHGAGTSR
jgi:DNA-binding transcriptional MerR regulator